MCCLERSFGLFFGEGAVAGAGESSGPLCRRPGSTATHSRRPGPRFRVFPPRKRNGQATGPVLVAGGFQGSTAESLDRRRPAVCYFGGRLVRTPCIRLLPQLRRRLFRALAAAAASPPARLPPLPRPAQGGQGAPARRRRRRTSLIWRVQWMTTDSSCCTRSLSRAAAAAEGARASCPSRSDGRYSTVCCRSP